MSKLACGDDSQPRTTSASPFCDRSTRVRPADHGLRRLPASDSPAASHRIPCFSRGQAGDELLAARHERITSSADFKGCWDARGPSCCGCTSPGDIADRPGGHFADSLGGLFFGYWSTEGCGVVAAPGGNCGGPFFFGGPGKFIWAPIVPPRIAPAETLGAATRSPKNRSPTNRAIDFGCDLGCDRCVCCGGSLGRPPVLGAAIPK